ncbi:MAG: chromosome partitioning protein ParA [Nitrospira bacterium SG8_3]|nr:MAG: chromosome partitioning protein ParA [Nitrospira bacterium SG8_3]
MHSCLYEGWVRHRRFEPKAHTFTYPVVYAYLDLDELDHVFEGRWLWSTTSPAPIRFRRMDYLGDSTVSLKAAVRERIERETDHFPSGPIRVLSHLRHFGFSFNPVSFYYCFDSTDRFVETIVAEITNTPWSERHAYVLPRNDRLSQSEELHFRFEKVFHVSPFMPMNLQYDWAFETPDQHLMVHMKNLDHDRTMFDAMLTLERQPINSFTCARALIRYPMMPIKVMSAIYWQALKLFLKRIPFYSHPSTLKHPTHGGAQSGKVL